MVKATTKTKEPKTIKVKTLLVSAAIVAAVVASFVCGILTANAYRDKVQDDAIALAKQLSKQ